VRPFIDAQIAHSSETSTRATNAYLEIEQPLTEGNALIFYIAPRSESSVFVLTCWDHAFDDLIPQLDDENTAETVAETWPILAQLLMNGIKDRYRDGALIRLEDPDDGETKWFVASIAGNLRLDSPDDLMSEPVMKVVQVVLERTMQLHKELMERAPDQGKMFGRAVKGALGAAVLGALAALLGAA
jgi:hypothetical protein